ncbi:MAG: UDP-2,3-diacylglucosamine diphosphatase [Kangiellaceae bacterium]|nr:UDP-2,3-diacylglucosamine diphosphatase [Kangiellaceae bacterium]MCW8998853.1 UDP-2,3-diacylglucosamine diphosphatase [Kangiellaceae bacterium]
MPVLHFISDLHLVDKNVQLQDLFFHYMQNIAPQSDQLFVLGDLFEVWLGDDAQNEMSRKVISAFRNYSDNGGKLFFGHGNRDFLLGENFARETGGQIISEPYNFKLNDKQVCLLHGDSLCTDDVPYQQLRAMVRNSEWQQQFLSKSVPERIQFAAEVQAKSKDDKQMKSSQIMDVNQEAVIECFNENNCDLLIHGHTHRPDTHHYTLENGKDVQRIVLSDWGTKGHYLSISGSELKEHYFSI